MKNLWKIIKSYTAPLAFLSLICAVTLSCETDPEMVLDPDIVDSSSSIIGCQFPVPSWNDTMMVQVGSFRVLNNGPAVYQAFGFSFTVAFKGTINELGIKVFETGTYTVRVYNEDPLIDDVLAEASIVADKAQWTYLTIDALPVDPTQTYMVCVYVRSKAEGDESFFYHIPDLQYPITVGDVTIENYASKGANEMEKPVPSSADSHLFNGFVDFCYQAE